MIGITKRADAMRHTKAGKIYIMDIGVLRLELLQNF